VKAHFLRPLLKRSGGPLRLLNERTGLPVATTLEGAFDSASRKRGLLGRDSLPPGHALIIAPSNLVHTFFMRFPIDILIAARDGRVVKARQNVPARRLVGALRGFAVIEMAANELERSGTAAGDRLLVVE
jgi:hypothetical protein